MALERDKRTTQVQPIGVLDTTGLRRSSAETRATGAEIARGLEPIIDFSAQELRRESMERGIREAADTELARDPETGEVLPPDRRSNYFWAGEAFNRVAGARYQAEFSNEVQNTLRQMATTPDFRNNPGNFQAFADQYVAQKLSGVPPELRPDVEIQSRRIANELFNGLAVRQREEFERETLRQTDAAIQREGATIQSYELRNQGRNPGAMEARRRREEYLQSVVSSGLMAGSRADEIRRTWEVTDFATVIAREARVSGPHGAAIWRAIVGGPGTPGWRAEWDRLNLTPDERQAVARIAEAQFSAIDRLTQIGRREEGYRTEELVAMANARLMNGLALTPEQREALASVPRRFADRGVQVLNAERQQEIRNQVAGATLESRSDQIGQMFRDFPHLRSIFDRATAEEKVEILNSYARESGQASQRSVAGAVVINAQEQVREAAAALRINVEEAARRLGMGAVFETLPTLDVQTQAQVWTQLAQRATAAFEAQQAADAAIAPVRERFLAAQANPAARLLTMNDSQENRARVSAFHAQMTAQMAAEEPGRGNVDAASVEVGRTLMNATGIMPDGLALGMANLLNREQISSDKIREFFAIANQLGIMSDDRGRAAWMRAVGNMAGADYVRAASVLAFALGSGAAGDPATMFLQMIGDPVAQGAAGRRQEGETGWDHFVRTRHDGDRRKAAEAARSALTSEGIGDDTVRGNLSARVNEMFRSNLTYVNGNVEYAAKLTRLTLAAQGYGLSQTTVSDGVIPELSGLFRASLGELTGERVVGRAQAVMAFKPLEQVYQGVGNAWLEDHLLKAVREAGGQLPTYTGVRVAIRAQENQMNRGPRLGESMRVVPIGVDDRTGHNTYWVMTLSNEGVWAMVTDRERQLVRVTLDPAFQHRQAQLTRERTAAARSEAETGQRATQRGLEERRRLGEIFGGERPE